MPKSNPEISPLERMNWKVTAEFVGFAAIVASLVFVGFQMKQSQDIAIAAQYQERYTTAMDYWISKADDEFSRRRLAKTIMERAGLPSDMDENTTADEFAARWIDVKKTLLVYDNMHFQYESGFLSDESWRAYRAGIERFADVPSYQYVLKFDRDFYRSSFVSLIDEIRQEGHQD